MRDRAADPFLLANPYLIPLDSRDTLAYSVLVKFSLDFVLVRATKRFGLIKGLNSS